MQGLCILAGYMAYESKNKTAAKVMPAPMVQSAQSQAASTFNKEYLKITWDVIVVGGGPAGMMAAIVAAERGKRVIILEKNEKLGKKLLITGGGRCNVTNHTLDNRVLLKKYGDAEQYLFSAFSQFAVEDTLEFFKKESVDTKIEAEQRVFPVSNQAYTIWNALVQKIKTLYVQVYSNIAVSDLIVEDIVEPVVDSEEKSEGKKITGVVLKIGEKTEKLFGHSIILATGGISHPETGSTGDGFKWLKKIGHTVIDPIPSLVPLSIKDVWVKDLQGITLTDIKLTVWRDDFSAASKGEVTDATVSTFKKEKTVKGKILFTHFGISGPTVLNLSKSVSDFLKYDDVYISLDLRPDLDHGTMNALLQKTFEENKNKQIKNALDAVIPSALIAPVLEHAGIVGETMCNSVTRENRMALIAVIKQMKMKVKGLMGDNKAVVSSGGIALDEVDFKTMESKKFAGLFVVGDVLNIDRPSGGYSLQLCWTTGFVAGQNV